MTLLKLISLHVTKNKFQNTFVGSKPYFVSFFCSLIDLFVHFGKIGKFDVKP